MEKIFTDAQVEAEIARLKNTDEVRLAQKEQRIRWKIKNQRRNQMYQLRNLEKRGKALKEAGITADNIEAVMLAAAMADDIPEPEVH